ncbi:MAG: hypothetical protein ACSHX9_15250 [Luteolibacter sp.]
MTKVTKVAVSTGEGQTSDVYVAEAEVLQTLKSDYTPAPEKRTIAVVGSTIPNSSAVWRPIETTRYLAFLNREQGHYRFGEMYAMRPITPEGMVEWLEEDTQGIWRLTDVSIEDAVKRIQSEQGGADQPATTPVSKPEDVTSEESTRDEGSE